MMLLARRTLVSAVVVVVVGVSAALLPAPTAEAGATTGPPSGLGAATLSIWDECSAQCYGWVFEVGLNGTFTLGGMSQIGSLSIGTAPGEIEVVSQSATSATFDILYQDAILRGSTEQGQQVSGSCGGPITATGVTGTDGSTFVPAGPLTAQLDCTVSLGGAPAQTMSILIAGVVGTNALGTVGLPLSAFGVPDGIGSYTTT